MTETHEHTFEQVSRCSRCFKDEHDKRPCEGDLRISLRTYHAVAIEQEREILSHRMQNTQLEGKMSRIKEAVKKLLEFHNDPETAQVVWSIVRIADEPIEDLLPS
jgi:hypothetical protein